MYIVTENPLPPALRTSECPVCYEDLSSSDKTIPIVLNCSHIFCITCIRRILDKGPMVTCPLCRGSTRMKTGDLFSANDTTTGLEYLGYILFLLAFCVTIYIVLPSELTDIIDSEFEIITQNTLSNAISILKMVLKTSLTLSLFNLIYKFLCSGLLLIEFILFNIQDAIFSF